MLLQAKNISKSVKGKNNQIIKILEDLNLEIEAGEFLAIIGPSGSGKTTLLQILGLMDRPTGGELIFSGRSAESLSLSAKASIRAKEIGFMFQNSLLLIDLTVEENLILCIKNINSKVNSDEVNNLLEKVGLKDKKQYYPRMLSAGEAQRAALARAIVNKPGIILADEPIANLDRDNKIIILELLKSFNEKYNITVVLASHDELVMKYASRNIKLIDGKFITESKSDNV